MGKSIWDVVAPVAGGILGTLVLPGVGTALGTTIGTSGGAAIGAGVGSALNTGIKTGNPLAGLASGAVTGLGSYAGSQLLGPSIGGIGSSSGEGTITGTPSPGFFGTPLSKSLGDTALSGVGNALGSTTPGELAGGSIGSSFGQSTLESAVPDLFSQQVQTPQGWSPSRQSAMQLPQSLAGYSGLSPEQQASNLATQGVYGGGQGPQENQYFLNLVNRQLVDPQNRAAADFSSLSPIENSYLNQIGLGGYNNPTDLLQGISRYGS